VLVAVLLNALASLMLKLASHPPFQLPSTAEPWVVLKNWPLLLGLLSYCLAFVVYAFAVSRLPLGVVYPVLTSGAIALVVLLSAFLLREPLKTQAIVGVMLVLFGVVLITRQ
jgi:small multidrug resistance pump